MIEIPDNIRPYVKQLLKYHFWLLAVLMPLVLVPLAFTADATLIRQIGQRRQDVESKLKSVEAIERAQAEGFPDLGHPQAEWAEQIDRSTSRLRRQILAQWKNFWEEQRGLRVWPEELRSDFIKRVTGLKPGDTLSARLVERYQNTVRQLVRKLPARLDAAEMMQEGDFRGGGRRSVPRPDPSRFEPELLARHLVTWDAADQSALYATFNWQEPPSTTQILLAQEELWVYETLCDAIAAANAGATGPHNTTIAAISQLAVGYRAALSNPTGHGGGRVRRLQAAANGMDMGMGRDMGMDMGMGMGMDGEASSGPPPNPRFAGSSPTLGEQMPGEMLGGGFADEADSADSLLRNWIYVDADGRPLTAEELETSPDTKLAHLVPFVVRGRVDQRKFDRLLRTLATWPVPIDVRQVRINPGATGGGAEINRPMIPQPGRDGSGDGGVRRYDFTVELRGMIALANPPDPAILGIDESGDSDPAAADALPSEE